MRISIGLAIALVSVVPATAGGAAREITPFQLLADGSIVVPVTIGGTGHYRFVLDTGSSRTVISSRLWKALRLPVVAKTVIVTPARRHDAYVVRLHGIAIAGGPAVDLAAAVIEADRYADGQQIDGLIGQDLLATAIYTIDYRQRLITWHAPGDTFAGVRLPLVMHDNRMLVSLAQCEGDASPLQLIPDTGSDSVVLFSHAQGKLRIIPREVGLLWSMSSARLAQRIEVERLVIGDTLLRDPPAVIVDSGAAGDLMGDGLLPLHLFSRVTFNAAERYLIVQK
jgi:predicted aspartyl protease